MRGRVGYYFLNLPTDQNPLLQVHSSISMVVFSSFLKEKNIKTTQNYNIGEGGDRQIDWWVGG